MCLPAVPMAIAGAGIQAAASIAGFVTDKKKAKAQDQVYLTNALNANKDQEYQRVQQTRKRVSELSAIGQQVRAINIDAMQGQSSVAVSGAEGGVGGGIMQDFADQVERDRLNAVGVQKTNADTINLDSQTTSRALQAQRDGRVNSVQRGNKPGVLGLVADLGTIAVGAGDKIASRNQQQDLLRRQTTVKPRKG